MTHAEDAPAARRSIRGQSLVEFALIVPILLVMFIAIADFGRIFAAIIALEASTRNAAEAAANQYLAQPPGPTALQLAAPAGDSAYYNALHTNAAGVVCAELRGLPGTNYDSATQTCPDMPVVMVCVHDSQDPSCGTLASPGNPTAPAGCTSFSPSPDNGQGSLSHPRPRWVEVRTCYRFDPILQIPLFSLGGFWLQRTNEFTIPCYFYLGIDECGDS
jgi:Flp pilus assembly protein TadG